MINLWIYASDDYVMGCFIV